MGVNEDAAPAAAPAAASPPTTAWASARTWEGAPSESAAPGELETARPSAAVVLEHRRAEREQFVVVAAEIAVQPQVVAEHAVGGHAQCIATAAAVQGETPR